MDSLIERLEKVIGGTRELDTEIALANGLRHRSRGKGRGREWFKDSHGGWVKLKDGWACPGCFS